LSGETGEVTYPTWYPEMGGRASVEAGSIRETRNASRD